MTASRADAALEQPTPSAWVIPVLTLATFVTMLHAVALAPVLPAIADDLGTSVSLLGQIPALTMLLAAALGLIAGPLADQFGHHRALIGGLLVAVVSASGMALAPGYIPLLLAALIGSIGRAVVQPVAVVIAGDRFEGDGQRRAISWVMAGITGAVIAGIPAVAIIADAFGWRAALVALAIVTAFLIPVVHRGLGPAQPHDPARVSIERMLLAYRPVLLHYPTLALILATLLGSAGIWTMATYLGAFYHEQYGYTTQQIGWVYAVPGVTLFLGSLAAGGRVGAFPLRPLVVITRIVTGLAIAGVLILPIPALASLGLLAVQGLTTGLAGVAVVFLLVRESPAGRAVTMTLNAAALSLGSALGSAVGGLLLGVAGFSLLGLCSLLFSAAAALMVWTSRDSIPSSEYESKHARERTV